MFSNAYKTKQKEVETNLELFWSSKNLTGNQKVDKISLGFNFAVE